MRLIWGIIPLILFGIVGFSTTDARCLGECPNYMSTPRITNSDGWSIDKYQAGQELFISHNIERFYEEQYCMYSQISKNDTIYCSDDSEIMMNHTSFDTYYSDNVHEFLYIVEISGDNLVDKLIIEKYSVGFDEFVDVNIPWTPPTEGDYFIDVTVIKSIEEPVHLLSGSIELFDVQPEICWGCNEYLPVKVVYSLKQQLEDGILSENVQCYSNQILVFKNDGSPACVYWESATKLLQRDWATNYRID